MSPRAGLQNWQWMFLVEGFMAVAVGVAAYWRLDDRPAKARWLPSDEKDALVAALTKEENERRTFGPQALLPLLRDPRVMLFVLIYLLIQMSVYGVVFYLPTEVSAILHKPAGLEVGLVSAIPWTCALIAAYWLPTRADKSGNHRLIAAATMLVAGSASFLFPRAGPLVGLITMSIAVSGLVAVQPLFWTFPTGYLADRAAAGGIALVSLGNLGGFLAPPVKVWADAHFKSPLAGLYLLAALTVLNAGLIALVKTGSTRRQTRLALDDKHAP
jgi:hypothetical protein